MESTETLKEAVLWEPAQAQKVQCRLCSFRCRIGEGKLGHCNVRKNIGGKLYSLNYHKVCATNVDPIEKKPMYHFQPGSRSFSIAAVGCNFRCEFCQNWQISQAALETGRIDGEAITPEQIVEAAVRSGCKSIAYTYTEPTIFMELCNDCARPAKERGLANVFVSNGYMTREAIDFAADWLDGINVDLKAFTDDYYKKLCGARLEPVLDSIAYIARQTKIWIEITTLLLPGQNDSEEELKKLADWLVTRGRTGGALAHQPVLSPVQVHRFRAHAAGVPAAGRRDRQGRRPALRVSRQRARHGRREHLLLQLPHEAHRADRLSDHRQPH